MSWAHPSRVQSRGGGARGGETSGDGIEGGESRRGRRSGERAGGVEREGDGDGNNATAWAQNGECIGSTEAPEFSPRRQRSAPPLTASVAWGPYWGHETVPSQSESVSSASPAIHRAPRPLEILVKREPRMHTLTKGLFHVVCHLTKEFPFSRIWSATAQTAREQPASRSRPMVRKIGPRTVFLRANVRLMSHEESDRPCGADWTCSKCPNADHINLEEYVVV